MPVDSDPAYAGYRCGQAGHAYNEAAFRHFLAIDRRRAERSRRSLLLVLVTARQGGGVTLTGETAATLFRAFGASIREVDFVGWYQQGRVAGAVLAQGNTPLTDRSNLNAGRVIEALQRQLPAALSRNLRVRVVQLGGRAKP